ncbi:MAG: hypothetical protein GX050_08060 [Firmicutes bacterium]|nr:hypothetical protein [Bacillota bacterium]
MRKLLMLGLVLSLLMVANLAMAALPDDAIIIEAEDAVKMPSNAKIVEAEGASGGKALDADPNAIVEYEFEIPSPGNWYVWVRMFCPSGDADSLYIGIDGATPNPEDAKAPRRALRIYSAAGDSVNTSGESWNVWYWDAGMEKGARSYFRVRRAGKAKMYIIGRESGTLIDQIILTKDKDYNTEQDLQGGPAAK